MEYFSDGIKLFEEMCAREMEGVVAKLASGIYDPKATTSVKIKNPKYSQLAGRRELFDGFSARRGAGSSTRRSLPQAG